MTLEGASLHWLSNGGYHRASQLQVGVGGQVPFNPSLFTQKPEHPRITGNLPLRLLNSFKDTRVTEQCHLADGRSCLGEGERLALMPSQRWKTFSLNQGKGVSFSVQKQQMDPIFQYFLIIFSVIDPFEHRMSTAVSCLRKKEIELIQQVAQLLQFLRPFGSYPWIPNGSIIPRLKIPICSGF